MSGFTVNDLEPPLTGALTSNGAPVANFTGATLEAHIERPDGTVLIKTVTITDAPTAAWTAAPWDLGDLNLDGAWKYEVQVMWSGNRPQTFPGNQFYVQPQIA